MCPEWGSNPQLGVWGQCSNWARPRYICFIYFLGPTRWIHLKRFLIPCNFGLKNKSLDSIIFPKMLRSHERQLKTTKTPKTIQVVDHWPKLPSVLIKGALAEWNWVRTKEWGRILWGSGASLPQNVSNSHAHSFELKKKALTNSGRGFVCFTSPLTCLKRFRLKKTCFRMATFNIITLAQMNYGLSGRLGGSQQKSVP